MLTMIGIINAKAGPSACASLRWQWFATTRARVNSERYFTSFWQWRRGITLSIAQQILGFARWWILF